MVLSILSRSLRSASASKGQWKTIDHSFDRQKTKRSLAFMTSFTKIPIRTKHDNLFSNWSQNDDDRRAALGVLSRGRQKLGFCSNRFMTNFLGIEETFTVDEHNWKNHPSLTETIYLPSIIVPSEHLHSLLSQGTQKGILVPFLATKMEELENIHPRLKVVQDLQRLGVDVDNVLPKADNLNNISLKAILLDPDSVCGKQHTQTMVPLEDTVTAGSKDILANAFPLMSDQIINQLVAISARQGPIVPIKLTYEQQSIQHILEILLPREVHPAPTGFEQIGHVIHLNLKSHHEPYKKLIGSVILDRLSPKVKTVVNKIGEVSGPYRVYDMDLLAGSPNTTVQLNEDGVSLEFDLKKVYWCTRLSGERKRLLEEIQPGDVVADAFCGAGAFVVQAAMKLGCTVYANDLNPDAVRYCRENAKRNLKRFINNGGSHGDGEGDTKFKPKVEVTCGDAFDFIQNLCTLENPPQHVVMNFPLESTSFLGALRWWPVLEEKKSIQVRMPTIHLYTFARGDDPEMTFDDNLPPRDALEVAVDLVAEGLVPEGGAIKATRYRRSFLNKLGCDVKAREVRDVAPGKVVICVSFKVTNTLLRIMQGDFVDF